MIFILVLFRFLILNLIFIYGINLEKGSFLLYVYRVFCLHICVSTMCMSGAGSSQKWVWDSLDLELQTVWATMWVLASEPRSPERAASALSWWAVSPALLCNTLKYNRARYGSATCNPRQRPAWSTHWDPLRNTSAILSLVDDFLLVGIQLIVRCAFQCLIINIKPKITRYKEIISHE